MTKRMAKITMALLQCMLSLGVCSFFGHHPASTYIYSKFKISLNRECYSIPWLWSMITVASLRHNSHTYVASSISYASAATIFFSYKPTLWHRSQLLQFWSQGTKQVLSHKQASMVPSLPHVVDLFHDPRHLALHSAFVWLNLFPGNSVSC